MIPHERGHSRGELPEMVSSVTGSRKPVEDLPWYTKSQRRMVRGFRLQRQGEDVLLHRLVILPDLACYDERRYPLEPGVEVFRLSHGLFPVKKFPGAYLDLTYSVAELRELQIPLAIRQCISCLPRN